MTLPEIHELVLENGFKALLVERRALPVVATTLWYGVGSRDERSGETGVSHFLEHMMFKGSKEYAKGEIDSLTSKLGGSNNAFTDSDVTTYHFSLASDRWEQALEIEASRMRGSLLDPDEFRAEKSVVLEELAMGEDEPMRLLHHAAEAHAFLVHPYHHPVIGWREDLERLSVETMRAYYGRNYGPNRAVLVAAGDLDLDRTKRRIEGLFGPIPRAAERGEVLAEPQQKGERRAVVHFPGDVARLAITAKTCRMGEPDDFVLDVLASVLGGGKTSRLYRRLVLEDRIATGVSVHNETRKDPGLFWVVAEMIEGKDPGAAERAIREELEKVRSRGVTAAELQRTRTLLRASFLFDQETALDVAMKVGRFEALSVEGWRLLPNVLARFERVGSKDVQDLVERYFGRDRTVVVCSVDTESPQKRPSRARAPRRAPGRAPRRGRGRK